MTNKQRAYLLLHISVALWGFTAILGALISLSAFVLVWYRVAITSILLLFWPGLIQNLIRIPVKDVFRLVAIGSIVALHWLCFYGSIKLANASIALIAMSTTALFTSFIEPLWFKRKIDQVDIGLSILIIPAVIITIQDFDFNKLVGFGIGTLAAFLYAFFAVLNKQYVYKIEPHIITFLEMTSSVFILLILSPIILLAFPEIEFSPTLSDWLYIIALSVFCTILPFILNLIALKNISAFASNLALNLEPVYGILLAVFILNENRDLSWSFYIGVMLIMAIILIYPFIKKGRQAVSENINS